MGGVGEKKTKMSREIWHFEIIPVGDFQKNPIIPK
jgi:hypothetical protein